MPHILEGRIVTMDGQVIDDGRLYIEGERIVAVRAKDQTGAQPAGFSGIAPTATQGTIYPGLIDLHGHLPYDIVAPWQVPQRFSRNAEWRVRGGKYDRLIQEPMKQLGSAEAGLAADIVRVVECKALLGGTTSIQGLRSSLANVSAPLYTGLVRNVELTGHRDLPNAGSNLRPEAKDIQPRMPAPGRPARRGAYIVHLCEGVDGRTRGEFDALARAGVLGAPGLVCIHCLDLQPQDHLTLQQQGAGTIWSPTSNLLLYGQTLTPDVLAPDFVLGKDWSPTGGRNLLQELKVAWLMLRAGATREAGDLAESLVQAVTCRPARRLGWEAHAGRLKEGLLADLLVIDADLDADPYQALVKAHEGHVRLVMIGGVARAGEAALMASLTTSPQPPLEPWLCNGRAKSLHLDTPAPGVPAPTLATALRRLQQAAADIPAWLAAAAAERERTPATRPWLPERHDDALPMRGPTADVDPDLAAVRHGRMAWAALVLRSRAMAEAAEAEAEAGAAPVMRDGPHPLAFTVEALPAAVAWRRVDAGDDADLELDLPALPAPPDPLERTRDAPLTERPRVTKPAGAVAVATHLALAGMTVIDDARYFDGWNAQPNLPDALKGPQGLAAFYRGS